MPAELLAIVILLVIVAYFFASITYALVWALAPILTYLGPLGLSLTLILAAVIIGQIAHLRDRKKSPLDSQ